MAQATHGIQAKLGLLAQGQSFPVVTLNLIHRRKRGGDAAAIHARG